MIDLIEESQRLLIEAGIAAALLEIESGRALAFESRTVLGFIVAYSDSSQLLERWSVDAGELIKRHQLGLRRSQAKAWNTYTIFVAGSSGTLAERVALSAIEEDLTGTRKIARVGIGNVGELRAALLPLLPIQNAPRLEGVDMEAEIKMRTTELPLRVVEAFLSLAPEATVIQVLEEEP